jgi:hypothetical protein
MIFSFGTVNAKIKETPLFSSAVKKRKKFRADFFQHESGESSCGDSQNRCGKKLNQAKNSAEGNNPAGNFIHGSSQKRRVNCVKKK